MVAPLARRSSPMPRGLTHAPHSQCFLLRDESGAHPGATLSSGRRHERAGFVCGHRRSWSCATPWTGSPGRSSIHGRITERAETGRAWRERRGGSRPRARRCDGHRRRRLRRDGRAGKRSRRGGRRRQQYPARARRRARARARARRGWAGTAWRRTRRCAVALGAVDDPKAPRIGPTGTPGNGSCFSHFSSGCATILASCCYPRPLE